MAIQSNPPPQTQPTSPTQVPSVPSSTPEPQLPPNWDIREGVIPLDRDV